MTILAFEFSSEQRSVAVARGGLVLGEALESGGRSTAAFALIENVLAQAKMEREEIEAIAVGLGPGSYTGVRAAIALAQGWQLARGTKTASVNSVVAIAERARAEKLFGQVNVVVDAQRGEFYFAAFQIDETSWKEVAPLKILPAAEVQSRAKEGQILIGPEAAKFFPHGRTIFPHATAVARLAAGHNEFLAGGKLEPIYLRETTFVKAAR
jgi:tRNA threonylcarbamoyl adenosine modification protein YeaZ